MFIGITAFESKENLLKQIDNLYSKNNIYYIHYNKRNVLKHPFKYLDLKKTINKKYHNVYIFTKYRVYWGDFSIVKSVINLQKIFLRTNEDIFLHVDQKTVAIKPIDEIEKYIKNDLKNGFNYFNFNRNQLEETYINTIQKKYNNKKYLDYYTKSNWHKKTNYKNSKFYKFNSKFWLLSQYLFSKYFFQSLFNFKGSIINFLNDVHAYRKIMSYAGGVFYKKQNSLNLKKFEFKTYCSISPFLVMNRKDLITILNSNDFEILYNYSKKKYVPEDFFFPSLYWNIISNKKNKSKCIIFYNDINFSKINDIINKDYLFCRRVIFEK